MLFAGVLLLSACVSDKGADTDYYTVKVKSIDVFNQEVMSFAQGEQIVMQLEVENISDEPRTLHFPSTQQYDFVIRDRGTKEVVWRWSDQQSFDAVVSYYTVEPHQTRTTVYKWNQVMPDFSLIPRGLYILEGQALGIGIVPQQNLTIL